MCLPGLSICKVVLLILQFFNTLSYQICAYSKEEVEGLINKAKVKITYEKKATKRYYKLGYYGEWKEYTGEFEITDNKTIYAYATGDNAVGNARKSVNYLTTGIASPIISIEPYGKSQQVKVSIEYASTAEITR